MYTSRARAWYHYLPTMHSAPRIDIQRHSKTVKHSPKMLEFFGETCTSLEIFSEFVGEGWRRGVVSWLKVK